MIAHAIKIKLNALRSFFNGILLTLVAGISTGLSSTNHTSAVSQYDLRIKILPEAHRFEVAGTWRLSPADSVRNNIEFYLSPKMRIVDMQLIEPQSSLPLLSSTREDAGGDMKWTLKPTKAFPAGEAVVLQFSCVSDTSSAPQLNISPESSFAGGGGELWYPQVSFSVRETGTLQFTVPTGETVISNGTLQSSSEQSAQGNFTFLVTQPSKFGFACGKYTVIRRTGTIRFALYLLRPTPHADSILSGCSKALDFLETLFGPIPYQQFSLVEVDFRSSVLGTGEYGFILADDSQFEKGFNLAYWSHEFGHQWWGNLVKSASGTPGRMMLSEGIAQFGALLG